MKKCRIIKVTVCFLTIILMVSLFLTGCGKPLPLKKSTDGKDATNQTPRTSTDEEISGDLELQIFVGGFGDEFWKSTIEDFKEEYPKVNVIVNMGAKVNGQMNPRWMSDNPPDFLFCDGPDLPNKQYAKEGKLMDLKEWLENTKIEDGSVAIRDNIYKDLISEDNNGKIFGAPYIFGTLGMWYDAELFRDNNLTVPTNFEEFMNTASLLKEKNIALMIYPGTYPSYLYEGFFQQGLAVDGGKQVFEDVDALKPEVFTSEPFLRNMAKLEEMAESDNVIFKESAKLGHIQAQLEWLNRKAAFIPNGLWLENEMKKDIPSDFEMKFLPSLIQEKGQSYLADVYSHSLSLSQKGKNPAAAKAWLTFLYREDILLRFTELTGVPTACKMDLSNADVSEVAKNVQKWIVDPSIKMVPVLDWEENTKNMVLNAVNSVALGKTSAVETCEQLKKEAERIAAKRAN